MGRKLIKVAPFTAVVIEPFKNDYGDYIGLREFYKPRDDKEAEWRPTRNGFSFPVDAEKLKKLRKAIKWAEDNFADEHKVLESKKPKGKKEEKKGKASKKSKKAKDEDDDD